MICKIEQTPKIKHLILEIHEKKKKKLENGNRGREIEGLFNGDRSVGNCHGGSDRWRGIKCSNLWLGLNTSCEVENEACGGFESL